MAEELTIDTSKLTSTAVQFGKGMTAFLDTEYEYIQYLRNRTGVMGGGSGMAGARNLVQLDYAKKWHHPTYGGIRLPSMPTQIPKKPKGFPRSKLNRFNQQRMTRRIYNQLRKMGLKPNQIDEYLRLKNLGYNHTRAMEGARNLMPRGNIFTNMVDDFKRGFQRPDWMTRKNWGALRPGIRERAWNWLTKVKTGVGNNSTLQPRRWVRWLGKTKNFLTKPFKNIKIPGFVKGGLLTALTLIPDGIKVWNMIKEKRYKDASRHIIKTGVNYAVFQLIFGVTGAAAVLKTILSGGTLTGPAIAVLVGGTIAAGTGGQIAEDLTDSLLHRIGLHDDDKVTPKFAAGRFITGKFNNGAVITSPTRGMIGGTKALVGEANEAEIILPMSKIGDAISAVYREGASIMVGATLAFLGPIAGGPAVASLLGEAKRIGKLVGADTDVKVSTITLPEALPAIHSNKVNNKEDVSEDIESTSNKSQTEGSGSTTNTSSTTITGTDRWKTILPYGEPAFSSPFGMRWGRMHRGIDIGVWENNPVHAQEGGVVEQIIPKFGEYGGAVVISHPDGTANLYGHVYDYVVEPGQKVEKGDPLAKIIYYPGQDGSNQSHLHFERFNKSGTRIDPLPYFQQGGASIDAQTDATITPVNQGGPGNNIGRNISSSFVNIGSTLFNQNKQELIDTPVNTTNVGDTSNTLIPIPVPFPVPINKYITLPAEETNNETKMVIDVFGKGASRS